MPHDIPESTGDSIENPADFSRAILAALGLQGMRHVLSLEIEITGARSCPTLKIARLLTRNETRLVAEAIETQRFKLVPEGEPERDGFPLDACESTPNGELVTAHPVDRRFALTLPLAGTNKA